MEVLFLLFFLELALALDGQRVVFHANVQVLLFDARHFELEDDLLVVLIDVDGRHKAGSRQRAFAFVQVAEQRVDAVLQGTTSRNGSQRVIAMIDFLQMNPRFDGGAGSSSSQPLNQSDETIAQTIHKI